MSAENMEYDGNSGVRGIRSYPELYTPEYAERRRQAIFQREDLKWQGVDASDPQSPSGHARGLYKSTILTSDYRMRRGNDVMDVRPQDVIEILRKAGVNKWVLMGLHGYVGYLPQPRATQDVDILIGRGDLRRAKRSLMAAWPALIVEDLEAVTRFRDPADRDADGTPKPVIDLLLPWSQLNAAILKDYARIDAATGHCVPTLEAALASKYAAMISSFCERDRKEYDAGDFRRMVRANYGSIYRDDLRQLGALVWSDGATELEQFLEIAMRDEPFPV